LQVFFSVIIAAFSLGNAAPPLQSLAVARGAAYTVYQLIELVSAVFTLIMSLKYTFKELINFLDANGELSCVIAT